MRVSVDDKGEGRVGPTPRFHFHGRRGVLFGLTLDASAQSRHRQSARRVRPGTANGWVNRDKMDTDVAKRASGFRLLGLDTANVIVTLEDNADLPFAFQRYSHSGKLSVIHGYVLDQVPVSQLAALANSANTHRVHLNRPAGKHDALSSVAVNANAVDLGNGVNNPSLYGYTGAGVTVAFIDSGITSYQHPDLADGRVLAFVDFVNGRTTKYDDNGHGTAVAGIIGGTGKLSSKKYAGMAPGASLVSLKVLDENGRGSVGDILKALDWVYTNGAAYGVRVVNLSAGAAVTESYYTDPLTLATKALVDKGITVVAAAGNNGQNALGQSQWGGVVSPGNAPWVLTVCAFSTQRHLQRGRRLGRRVQLRRSDRRRFFSEAGSRARPASAWCRPRRRPARCFRQVSSRRCPGSFRARSRAPFPTCRTRA